MQQSFRIHLENWPHVLFHNAMYAEQRPKSNLLLLKAEMKYTSI